MNVPPPRAARLGVTAATTGGEGISQLLKGKGAVHKDSTLPPGSMAAADAVVKVPLPSGTPFGASGPCSGRTQTQLTFAVNCDKLGSIGLNSHCGAAAARLLILLHNLDWRNVRGGLLPHRDAGRCTGIRAFGRKSNGSADGGRLTLAVTAAGHILGRRFGKDVLLVKGRLGGRTTRQIVAYAIVNEILGRCFTISVWVVLNGLLDVLQILRVVE